MSVVFPVYTHLRFAYLVTSYYNECLIHSTILNKFQAFKVIKE